MEPKLTLIIPFLNEGEEVEQTMKSIREHSAPEEIAILLINDASTDGFDYLQIARKYQAEYIQNPERKGVASSRELGVARCRTPYFMLLDAHMRFYDDRWVGRITEELENDPQALLCCQTQALKWTHEVMKNRPVSYGACVNLYTGRSLWESLWDFDTKERPGGNTVRIPCVLGASYCCSKAYWQYLKGVEGLQQYGNDEAYISIKVYLSGGTCKLLTDVVVGHLYRSQAPYRVEDHTRIYNRLFLTELFLPDACKARFVSQTLHYYGRAGSLCKEALLLFYERREEIYSLKKYYERIFKRDFSYFEQLNRQSSQFQPLVVNKDELLKEIALHLVLHANQLAENGLMSGKTGVLLFLYEYSRQAGNQTIEWLADHILDEVLDHLDADTSWDFNNGLLGIGWAIEYLYQHQFIGGDTNEILASIDRQVLAYDIEQIEDLNQEKGLGGLVHYILARLYTIQKEKKVNPFHAEYLAGLYRKIKQLLADREKNSDSWVIFIRYAIWYKELCPIQAPSVYDIAFLMLPVDYEIRKYVIGLEGNAGVGLKLLFEDLKTMPPTFLKQE